MTREYIRAVKSRYSKQQHQSIIEAYLFLNLPVEEIASNYNAGEMDITVILSSYRILLSCNDRSENELTLKRTAGRSDRSIIVGQYVDIYYESVLADVSPAVYFNTAIVETEQAEKQKQTINKHLNEVIMSAKKKGRRVSLPQMLVRICAVLIFLSLAITVPIYLYNESIVAGDKNPDLSVYVYNALGGSYGGQGQAEPSGLGRLFTAEYDYVGQFARGRIRGAGCFINEDRVSYVGGVNSGKKHGTGLEYVRTEGALVLGVRKNDLPNGLVLKIIDDYIELYEYSGGVIKATLAIGNFKDVNFSIKNSAYNLVLENGYYRLGKKTDLQSGSGYIIEWAESDPEAESYYTLYFNEYSEGTLTKSLSYSNSGEVVYRTADFTIISNKDIVQCSENDSYQNLSAQYSYRNGEKSLLFGKYENGKPIKLGRLLETGEVVVG